MNALMISSIPTQSRPDFKLPEPYSHDVWPIKKWAWYENSDENRTTYCNTDDVDFSICKNEYIREEIKFFYTI